MSDKGKIYVNNLFQNLMNMFLYSYGQSMNALC